MMLMESAATSDRRQCGPLQIFSLSLKEALIARTLAEGFESPRVSATLSWAPTSSICISQQEVEALQSVALARLCYKGAQQCSSDWFVP
jgi:hypothetical protein